MAQFRGTLQGQRGQTSRLGSKASGLRGNLASWQGAVQVHLWTTDQGVDMVSVELTQHTNGAGMWPPKVVYEGPISGKDFPITLIGDANHAEAQQETVRRILKRGA